MENSQDKTFHLGICMAGAISAGAYTAGVMDYLLEALEHWEKAKQLQEEGKLSGIPKHKILIEVLGGTSAGGMTAAITAAAIQQKFEPVKAGDVENTAHTSQNPIFNAWVNLTEETKGKDMMSQMLDTSDIDNDKAGNKSKEVRAGLNSTFIKEIADGVLDQRLPEIADRPYVASNMDVFTTVTNLRGFNYKIKFKTSTGDQSFSMKMHRDYAFFKVGDEEYKKDGRIPVSFKTENINNVSGKNIAILKQAAMSTGAFPVGLESRTLKREAQYIQHSKYLNLRIAGEEDERVKYTFLPDNIVDFESLNVDGGVINNEPFEVTQQLIDDRRKSAMIEERKRAKNLPADEENLTRAEKEAIESIIKEVDAYQPETTAATFDSAVVMIDPFPSEQEDKADFAVKQAWKQVLPSVLSAMLGQLRLKESQIKRAYLSDDYTRFLVAPSRTVGGKDQKYTIACGSLGGFGGFFSKKFREHDFLLGRRNCQQFLQKHFSAPKAANGTEPHETIEGNFILEYGYSDNASLKWTYTTQKELDVAVIDEDGNKTIQTKKIGITYLPLIPDLRVKETGSGYNLVKPEIEQEPTYPKISLQYILGLKKAMKKRITCVLDNVTNPVLTEKEKKELPKNAIVERIRKKSILGKVFTKVLVDPGTKGYLWLGKTLGKGTAADMFIDAIITDMDTRGLIEDDYNK